MKSMTYAQACKLAGISDTRSVSENANRAGRQLRHLLPSAPLRFKVALQIIMNAAR